MPAVPRAVGASVVVGVAVFAACSSLKLGETEQESVVITTSLGSNNDFGSVQINSSSAPADVTISPAGTLTVSDTIDSVTSSSSEFVVSFPQGPPPAVVDQSCSSGSGTGTASGSATSGCTSSNWGFQVTFSPTGTAGTRSATIHISVDGVDQPITMTGTAVAPQYLIDASPNPLPFGYVKVATTSTDGTITVSNKGSQPLSISSVTLSDAGGVFAYAPTNTGSTGPHTLDAGFSESYTLTCTPGTTTAYTGKLTIASNATNSPTLTVNMTCTGTDSTLSTSPNPAKFPVMRVGDPAKTLSIAVTNSSATAANLMTPTLSADATPDLTIMSADTGLISNAGPPKHIVLRYAPTTPVGTNGYLGTLIVNYDSGKQYLATVFGEADPTAIAVSAGSIDFGPLCVGQQATQHVTAYASDVGAFQVTDVSMPQMPFTRTMAAGETLPYSVAGNHQGTDFAFDVAITAPAAMAYAGSLTITTDIPGKPMFPISLMAQGLPAGVSPTPAALDFPPTPVDTTSSGQTVVLSNCGSGPIDVQAATIIGPDASEFAIALPTDPTKTLQIHDSEMFALVMSPHSPGVKNATLVITYDSGSTSVPLDGNAGIDTGAGKDRETYYACSTGRPGAWWPIALALLALRRRRR
ncbi:MAG: choice-of-anchor D domain-containing protein [Acidobacteriota bacterium]